MRRPRKGQRPHTENLRAGDPYSSESLTPELTARREPPLLGVADEPALVAAAVAVVLNDIGVVGVSAALHVETFAAVYVHQFEIVVGTATAPSLVRSTIPIVLLHVATVTAAASCYFQHHAAVHTLDHILISAQANKHPFLVRASVAAILLDSRSLPAAIAINIHTLVRADVRSFL